MRGDIELINHPNLSIFVRDQFGLENLTLGLSSPKVKAQNSLSNFDQTLIKI